MAVEPNERKSIQRTVSSSLTQPVSRRTLLKRGAALGLSVPAVSALIAACADDDDVTDDDVEPVADDDEADDDEDEVEPDPGEVEPDEDEEEEEDLPDDEPDDEEEEEPDTDTDEPQYGGTLTFLTQTDFTNMWPTFSTGHAPQWCYDFLVASRHDGEAWGIEPMLAESWEITEETATFHLREDVEFHDGTPFDAEAAVWNVEQWKQHPLSMVVRAIATVNADTPAEVVDDYTIQLNLDQPDGILLVLLSDVNRVASIGSPTAWDEVDREEGDSLVVREAVGTGPFIFEEWVSGSHVAARRNENYWDTDEQGNQLPYVDEVHVRWIADDSVRLIEMRAGEADATGVVHGREVGTVEDDPNLVYRQDEREGGTFYRFFFNGLEGPFVDNPDLRKAVQYAIDREAMANVIGDGIGIPGTIDATLGAIGYDERVPYYSYDLERAWEHREASGVPSGFTFRYDCSEREIDIQQAEMVQQFVREIDLDVEINVLERVAWVNKVRENYDFDMSSQRATARLDPMDGWMLYWEPGPEPVAAYTRAEEPELWEKMLEARAVVDADERHEAYVEVQQMMYETAWFGIFWVQPANWAIHRRVRNFPAVWYWEDPAFQYLWLDGERD